MINLVHRHRRLEVGYKGSWHLELFDFVYRVSVPALRMFDSLADLVDLFVHLGVHILLNLVHLLDGFLERDLTS